MSKNKPKESKPEENPFRLGDVCRYTGDSFWSERHIIDECRQDGPNSWSYSTSCGAWLDHEELKLTEESSVSSRAELWQMKEDERDANCE